MGRLNKILRTKILPQSVNANAIRHIDVDGETKIIRTEIVKDFLPRITKAELPHVDIRSVTDATRFVQDCEKVYTLLQSKAQNLSLNDEVFCSKTGRFLFTLDAENLKLYEMMQNENNQNRTLALYTSTVAPHFINTSPEQLDKLRIVDPVGLFVWLASRLAGSRKESFDKAQTKAKTLNDKLVFINEKARTFDLIAQYALESDENQLKLAVCNDFMLKILAIASHNGLYREFRSHKPLFVSLTNCAKDLDAWANWLKETFSLIADKLSKGGKTDNSEVGMTRKAQIMQGDSSMRETITRDLNGRGKKRQWLKRLGINVLVLNHILDTITEDELLMPKLKDGAWPIDKLNDIDVKNQVHNTLVIKTQGNAGMLKGNEKRANTARKKLRKAVEVSDFLDMADIKPVRFMP